MQGDSNATLIPAALRVFIGEVVHSVEQLEILLYLFRADSPKSIADIVEKLRNHPHSCEQRLVELERACIVQRVDGTPIRFRYFNPSPERHHLVAMLSDEYLVRRHRVIDAIYARPLSGGESFAEAFKVRRDS